MPVSQVKNMVQSKWCKKTTHIDVVKDKKINRDEEAFKYWQHWEAIINQSQGLGNYVVSMQRADFMERGKVLGSVAE